MSELIRRRRPTVMILNREYKALGSSAFTLELTCTKCSKVYRITRYATPPSSEQDQEEPEVEVLRNIRQTTLNTHFLKDHCNGDFTDIKIT